MGNHGEENTHIKSWRNENGCRVDRTNIPLMNKKLQGHCPESGSIKITAKSLFK